MASGIPPELCCGSERTYPHLTLSDRYTQVPRARPHECNGDLSPLETVVYRIALWLSKDQYPNNVDPSFGLAEAGVEGGAGASA
jgi:hypothetical protein